MSPEEAWELIGTDNRVVANTGPGDTHATGRLIAYSAGPMVCILTDSGEKVWWAMGLTTPTTTHPPTPHGEALRAGEGS